MLHSVFRHRKLKLHLASDAKSNEEDTRPEEGQQASTVKLNQSEHNAGGRLINRCLQRRRLTFVPDASLCSLTPCGLQLCASAEPKAEWPAGRLLYAKKLHEGFSGVSRKRKLEAPGISLDGFLRIYNDGGVSRVADCFVESVSVASSGAGVTEEEEAEEGVGETDVIDCAVRCHVCDDKATGLHYGVMTCEGCKGFFKRTVQNRRIYECSHSQQCNILMHRRNNCQFCRFKKCLDKGMVVEAVRENHMPGGRNSIAVYNRKEVKKQRVDLQTPKDADAEAEKTQPASSKSLKLPSSLESHERPLTSPIGPTVASDSVQQGPAVTPTFAFAPPVPPLSHHLANTNGHHLANTNGHHLANTNGHHLANTNGHHLANTNGHHLYSVPFAALGPSQSNHLETRGHQPLRQRFDLQIMGTILPFCPPPQAHLPILKPNSPFSSNNSASKFAVDSSLDCQLPLRLLKAAMQYPMPVCVQSVQDTIDKIDSPIALKGCLTELEKTCLTCILRWNRDRLADHSNFGASFANWLHILHLSVTRHFLVNSHTLRHGVTSMSHFTCELAKRLQEFVRQRKLDWSDTDGRLNELLIRVGEFCSAIVDVIVNSLKDVISDFIFLLGSHSEDQIVDKLKNQPSLLPALRSFRLATNSLSRALPEHRVLLFAALACNTNCTGSNLQTTELQTMDLQTMDLQTMDLHTMELQTMELRAEQSPIQLLGGNELEGATEEPTNTAVEEIVT